MLGVNALSQAAVEHALQHGDAEIERRRHAVVRERHFLTGQLRALGADVTDSQANFLWIRLGDLSGDELANALRQQGVIVAPGGPLGEDHHIRAAVRNEAGVEAPAAGDREPALGRCTVAPAARPAAMRLGRVGRRPRGPEPCRTARPGARRALRPARPE